MCVVSLSHHTTSGHVEFRKKGQSVYLEYDLNGHRWQERKSVILRGQDRISARNGVPVPRARLSVAEGEKVTVYDEDGVFFGVGQGCADGFRMSFIAEP
jgi:hypothetical protein